MEAEAHVHADVAHANVSHIVAPVVAVDAVHAAVELAEQQSLNPAHSLREVRKMVQHLEAVHRQSAQHCKTCSSDHACWDAPSGPAVRGQVVRAERLCRVDQERAEVKVLVMQEEAPA